MRRREQMEPTDDWDQLVLLFEWPGQKEYEELRPLVLFGSSVVERSRVTGTPERTLYRKVERFENEGPLGLFSTEESKRQVLPPIIRRMIVDLKAEHPASTTMRLKTSSTSEPQKIRRSHRRKDSLGGSCPLEALPLVRALSRDREQQRAPQRCRGAAPGRLEREGHSFIPQGEPEKQSTGS